MAGQWWGDDADLGREYLRELRDLERDDRADADEEEDRRRQAPAYVPSFQDSNE